MAIPKRFKKKIKKYVHKTESRYNYRLYWTNEEFFEDMRTVESDFELLKRNKC